MSQRLRLFTLPPSHFCERARWGLDYAAKTYTEVPLPVGPHAILARRLAPMTTLPIIDTGSRIIQGSGPILDWSGIPGAMPPLEARFEERIGPLVRQYIYAACLGDARSNVENTLFHGVTGIKNVLGRAAWPLTRRAMIAGMNARESLLPAIERRLDAELDWFAGELSGRHFLVGNRLGRADITAASLLAPLARPNACPLYRLIRLPPGVEAVLSRWNQAPALEWVQQVYVDWRRSEPGSLVG